MMPAVVLLCSVYCACGGQLGSRDRSVVGEQDEPTASARCPKHSKHRDEQAQRDPTRSGHEAPGRSDCGHCGLTVAAQPTKVRGVEEPDAVRLEIAGLARAASVDPTPLGVVRGLRSGNRPPRAYGDSLLGLHCALTL